MVHLTRKITFSSGHRYFNPSLSEAENIKIFGSLYSEHGFGHNFILEATIAGELDSQTGLVVNLKDFDQVLKKITGPLDHHHINLDVPYFSKVVPTTETIAKYCFDEIASEIPSQIKLINVRLYEGENLWVDYAG